MDMGETTQTLPISYTNTNYTVLSPAFWRIHDFAGGYMADKTVSSWRVQCEQRTIYASSGWITVGY